MRTYAMTGGATGIGAELKRQLLAQGHTVISVDIKEGDIIADLSTQDGRQAAIDGVRELAPDGLDGFIPCAGLPPVAKPLSLIARGQLLCRDRNGGRLARPAGEKKGSRSICILQFCAHGRHR